MNQLFPATNTAQSIDWSRLQNNYFDINVSSYSSNQLDYDIFERDNTLRWGFNNF